MDRILNEFDTFPLPSAKIAFVITGAIVGVIMGAIWGYIEKSDK